VEREERNEKMKSQKNKKKSWIIFGILFAIILSVMGFGYFSNLIDSNVVNDMQKDFNAEILITDDFKIIYEGEKIEATIKVIPTDVQLDSSVTLNYYILDENGNRVELDLGEEQIPQITGQISIDKTIYTKDLVPGNYELYIDIKYNSDEETSSSTAKSQFSILKGKKQEKLILGTFSSHQIVIFLLIVTGFILTVMIIITILETNKFKKKNNKNKV
jgi:hypothetical protein